MIRRYVARASAAAFAVFACAAQSQQVPPDRAVITVTPLDADEAGIAIPASVLRGEVLRARQGASLGETLGREPGVHTSGMAPGATRPVIRGQDAPRVRLLDNGLDVMDVSTISPDHRPAVETFGASQVEILRGPATLLYGGGAVGGLVNVVTKRIPRDAITGVHGALELRGAGVDGFAAGLLDLNGGDGRIAWHLGAHTRRAGDYPIPGDQIEAGPLARLNAVRAAAGEDPIVTSRGRVRNSGLETSGLDTGVTVFGERGRVGVGLSMLSSFYGVPGLEEARIDLDRRRYELEGVLERPLPGFERARLRAGQVQYRHDEIEPTGEVATRFRNDARDMRLELNHTPIGTLRGAIGVSGTQRRFEATGAESFLAPVRGAGIALFVVEELRLGAVRFDAGLRGERERYRPDTARNLGGRSIGTGAASVGGHWTFLPGLETGVTLTRSQRAPAIEELYANGPHHATGTFEVGDVSLRREQARNLDLLLRGSHGGLRWKAGAYSHRFRDYIYARVADADGDGVFDFVNDRVDGSGTVTPGGEFIRVDYRQAAARFRGFEAEATWRPLSGPFGLRLFADAARGRIESLGYAPRMSPARRGLDFDWRGGALAVQLSLTRVERQSRIVVAQESETPGYTRIDASLAWDWRRGREDMLTVFVQGRNLGNARMRVHTSFNKDFAPLPGRGLVAGVRTSF